MTLVFCPVRRSSHRVRRGSFRSPERAELALHRLASDRTF